MIKLNGILGWKNRWTIKKIFISPQIHLTKRNTWNSKGQSINDDSSMSFDGDVTAVLKWSGLINYLKRSNEWFWKKVKVPDIKMFVIERYIRFIFAFTQDSIVVDHVFKEYYHKK